MPRQTGLVGLFNRRNRPQATTAREVHAALLAAIVDQRLPPATKLGEEALVEVFNMSRRQVSTALDRLSWEGLVVRVANRGASSRAGTSRTSPYSSSNIPPTRTG